MMSLHSLHQFTKPTIFSKSQQWISNFGFISDQIGAALDTDDPERRLAVSSSIRPSDNGMQR